MASAAPGAGRTDPATYLRGGRRPETTRVVACVGDSLTRADLGANYVALLEQRYAGSGHQFVNAGINGNLAWNVRQRLDGVLACRPDVVTLLVGTNDVIGSFDRRWEATYRRQQRIPQTPTLEWYLENVDAVLTRLRTGTGARLAVLDLPPLGEPNLRVDRYNAELHRLVAAHDLPCLPLHDRLVAALPAGHRAPPFRAGAAGMIGGWLRHQVLRQSWTEIGRRNGLALLVDHVHLAETAAGIVAGLVADFLDGA